MAVNDGAVMKAWGKSLGVEGSMVTLLGDPTGEYTKSLGLVMDHPGPAAVLGPGRCKRFAIFFDNGEAKAVHVSEGPDDPSGDGNPSASMVDAMLEVVA
mmetsp:Transcript_6639/g.15911  ORF Transcript_6639/g.15911 Transcript_6639/m.15911 type:complete len:99 (-) Transcript_6639:276-572(-)